MSGAADRAPRRRARERRTPRSRASCSPTSAPTSSSSSRPAVTRVARLRAVRRRRAGIPSAASGGGTTTRRKRGVVLDLDTARPTRRRSAGLVATADVVLEGEPPGPARRARPRRRRPATGAPRSSSGSSVTPFGRDGPRRDEPVHRPHRARRRRAGLELRLRRPHAPAGARRRQPGLPHRQRVGGDRRADRAACARRHRRGPARRREPARGGNVTTEPAPTSGWSRGSTVQRQTGRHAARAAHDDRSCIRRRTAGGHTPASRRARQEEFQTLLEWLDDLGLARRVPRDSCSSSWARRASASTPATSGATPRSTEIFRAGRDGLGFVASHLTLQEFFVGAQQRGLACGAIYAPEEVIDDRALRRARLPGRPCTTTISAATSPTRARRSRCPRHRCA